MFPLNFETMGQNLTYFDYEPFQFGSKLSNLKTISGTGSTSLISLETDRCNAEDVDGGEMASARWRWGGEKRHGLCRVEASIIMGCEG